MDFDLTDSQTHFRDRVQAFVDAKMRPRLGDYNKQFNEGELGQAFAVISDAVQAHGGAGVSEDFYQCGIAQVELRRVPDYSETEL